MTRIFFVLRQSHFSYHRSTIEALAANGVDLQLYIDSTSQADGTAESDAFADWTRANARISHHALPLRRDLLRKPLMFFRELRTYSSYCNRPDDFEYYRERWSHYMKLPPRIRRWLLTPRGRSVAGSAFVRGFATAVERIAPSSATIKKWLAAERPSLIVVSPGNLRHSEDVEVLKAARALGIATVVPVLSWDNLTTKGLFHIQPDLFLAWNDAHSEELTTYHAVDPRQIRLTGSPFFDKWFDIAEPRADRQAFLTRVGLNPERPFVLYLGSSANVAKDETWLIRELKQTFERHADARLRAMQILFRPHPANWQIGLSLAAADIGMWPRRGSLPDTCETFTDFRSSLDFAASVVGINTSGMLDAIICSRPVISPLVEGYRFTQVRAQHFNRMHEANAIYLAGTAAEVAGTVVELLDGNDPLEANRRAFTARFIRPRAMRAGEAQADEILSLLPQGARPAPLPERAAAGATVRSPAV